MWNTGWGAHMFTAAFCQTLQPTQVATDQSMSDQGPAAHVHHTALQYQCMALVGGLKNVLSDRSQTQEVGCSMRNKQLHSVTWPCWADWTDSGQLCGCQGRHGQGTGVTADKYRFLSACGNGRVDSRCPENH